MIELHKISAPGLLSTLTVDGDKDWGGYNITNFGSGAHDIDSALTLSADHISGATEDHSQYLLLAGRSGGQTAIGGTGSGDDLTLQSTSHATKGHIIFGSAGVSGYDCVNDRLGLNTLSPAARLQIDTGTAAIEGIRIQAAASQSGKLLVQYDSNGKIQGYIDDDGSISIGTNLVTANRTFRLWGTAIISSRNTSIGNAVMLIEQTNFLGNSNTEGLKTDVIYYAKSGDDPASRKVQGAHYHIDIRDITNRDLAGQYMAGYFVMEPSLTNGNTITGTVMGFDFWYKDASHHGAAPLVIGQRFREMGLQRATAALTEVRYFLIGRGKS